MDKRTQIAVLLVAVIMAINLAISARTQKERMAIARAKADSTALLQPPTLPEAGPSASQPDRAPAARTGGSSWT